MLNKLLGMVPNASEHGAQVDMLLEVCHWFMAILFVGWSIFFVYTIWRFHRSRNPKADYHGVQSKASAHLELSVVIIEACLLLGFAMPIWAKRVNGESYLNNPDAVRVHCIAEQFAWNFHYPGPDGRFGRTDPAFITPSNPLGIDPNDPDGKDDFISKVEVHTVKGRPTVVDVTSRDVIHSFAVPHMRVAQDAIPGSRIPIWFRPIRDGQFDIICGQLCGNGHYGMRGILVVQSQKEFDEWSKEQSDLAHPAAAAAAPAPAAPAAPAPAPAPAK
jgi:cytochrome c oxidase subunit 2